MRGSCRECWEYFFMLSLLDLEMLKGRRGEEKGDASNSNRTYIHNLFTLMGPRHDAWIHTMSSVVYCVCSNLHFVFSVHFWVWRIARAVLN